MRSSKGDWIILASCLGLIVLLFFGAVLFSAMPGFAGGPQMQPTPVRDDVSKAAEAVTAHIVSIFPSVVIIIIVGIFVTLLILDFTEPILIDESEANVESTDPPLGTATATAVKEQQVPAAEPTIAELAARPAVEPDGNFTELETSGKWRQPPSSSQRDQPRANAVPREGESARDRHRRWERDRFGLETRE